MKRHTYKRVKKILAMLLTVSTLLLYIQIPAMSETTAMAQQAQVISISAQYDGEPVMVGTQVDTSKLKVEATYESGMIAEVSGYTVSSKTVTKEGINQLMVIYQGKVAYFTVYGKKMQSAFAYYAGPILSVGNSVDKKDIKLLVTFMDGTTAYMTDFQVLNPIIMTTGQNKVQVIYQGKLYEVLVYGVPAKSVLMLNASYKGGPVTVGGTVDRDSLVVTATYIDGTTEIINNYVITPDTIQIAGDQMLTAVYNGAKVTFNVTGAYREVTGISVQYKGGPVGVGYSVRKSDVEVTATYNDGSKGKVEVFNLLSSYITYVGYQTVTVEANGYKAEFMVEGVAEQILNFDHGVHFTASNGNYHANVSIAIPSNLPQNCLKGTEVNPYSVHKIVAKTAKNSSYLAFDLEVEDEAILDEFPLTVKIIVPTGFKLDQTDLYYTPNRKTIIGKMNTDEVEPNVIITKIFHTGTYILAYHRTSSK